MSNKPTISESLAQSDRAIRELTAQRDELLACLKEILRQDREHGCWDTGSSFNNLLALDLIAKIETADKQP